MSNDEFNIPFMESQVSTEFTLRLSSGGQIRREKLIISEYFRARKIQQTFFFVCLFVLVLLVPYAKVQVLPVTH